MAGWKKRGISRDGLVLRRSLGVEVVVGERLEALVVRQLREDHAEVVGRDGRVDEVEVEHGLELAVREREEVVGGAERGARVVLVRLC